VISKECQKGRRKENSTSTSRTPGSPSTLWSGLFPDDDSFPRTPLRRPCSISKAPIIIPDAGFASTTNLRDVFQMPCLTDLGETKCTPESFRGKTDRGWFIIDKSSSSPAEFHRFFPGLSFGHCIKIANLSKGPVPGSSEAPFVSLQRISPTGGAPSLTRATYKSNGSRQAHAWQPIKAISD